MNNSNLSNTHNFQLLPLSYCSIDRAIRMFSQFNVEKEDIEHWIDTGIITPSVHMTGEYTALLTNDGSHFEFNKAIKSKLLDAVPEEFDLVLEEINEASEWVPESLNRVISEAGQLSRSYGLWKVISILDDDLAFISPTITNEFEFSCLTTQLSELPLVLEYTELKKIQAMVTTGEFLQPSNHPPLKNKEVLELLPKRKARIDAKPAEMIIALIDLLPSITEEDINGHIPDLLKKIDKEFKNANKPMPIFSIDTLRNWINKGLTHFDKLRGNSGR